MKLSHIKPISVVLILCWGIVVYFNTFFSSFHFDDAPSIVDNHFIRHIQDLQSIWDFLPRRFILYFSIAVNYHFHQLDVFGYHLFNLLVHLGAAILVWWLTLLTLSTPAMKGDRISLHAPVISLFTGLVFVAHPVQTEAVTYIVQRTASMATLFYLLSLCLYVRSRILQEQGAQAGSYYAGSLAAAIVAMFTKEIAITLPLMALLYEFTFFNNKRGLNWKRLAPFLCILCIIPMTMYLTESLKAQQMRGVMAESPSGIPWEQYLLTQFRAIATYIRLAFLPLNQNLDYDYPISKGILELPVLLSVSFLGFVLLIAKRLFLKYRLVAFAIFWFFLTLLPESSFLSLRDVIFEHRLYLPMAGFSMFLVSGVYYLIGKADLRMMVVALTVLVAGYSVLTYQRNGVWKDEATLWSDTVQKSPHKARPYNNRGLAHYHQGRLVQAMSDYNKAIEINPRYADAYYNRGLLYAVQGNLDQAILDFDQAIGLKLHFGNAYNNRGIIYSQRGNFAQAILDFNKAIESDARNEEFCYNRAFIYQKQGQYGQAMSDYSKAIDLGSRQPAAYVNRASIYAQTGRPAEALCDFTKAVEIDPGYIAAYNNRSVLYYQLKEYEKAWVDVYQIEKLGSAVDLEFMSALQRASGRSK